MAKPHMLLHLPRVGRVVTLDAGSSVGLMMVGSLGSGSAVLAMFVRTSVSSFSGEVWDGGRFEMKMFFSELWRASLMSSAAARMRSAGVATGIVYLLGSHVSVLVMPVPPVLGMCTVKQR